MGNWKEVGATAGDGTAQLTTIWESRVRAGGRGPPGSARRGRKNQEFPPRRGVEWQVVRRAECASARKCWAPGDYRAFHSAHATCGIGAASQRARLTAVGPGTIFLGKFECPSRLLA